MTAPPRRLRVLIVDDHEIVLEGLRALLEDVARVEVVGEASTMAGAIAANRELAPDVVVLDNQLADGTGVAACLAIRSEYPATRIVVLTAFADADVAAAALRAGASAFLLKRSAGDGLIRAVKGTGTEVLVDSELAVHLVARESPPSLTPAEARLARLVAAGFTNAGIAHELGASEATVKSRISRLLAHLGVAHRSEIAAHLAATDPPFGSD